MIGLAVIFQRLKDKFQRNKQRLQQPLDLFHGPFEPCEVFDSPSKGRVVALTIHTKRDIIFPAHYIGWDVTNWLFYHGYSIGFVSFDSTIKLTHDF